MTSLLLRAERMFDGEEFLESPRVLIEDDVVAAVSTHSDPPHGPETTVVDLPGTTLLPGLIDSHVHATLPGGMVPPTEPDHITAVVLGNLQKSVQAGVTFVRDCGSPGKTLLQLREDLPEDAAGFVLAGPALTVPNGHAHALGREVAGENDLRLAVEQLADSRVDFIKVIGCGGGTPGTDPLASSYSARELDAVVGAANKRGLPVTLHALNAETVTLGLEAGVRFFEHGWLYQDEQRHFRPELLDQLAASGAVICPTMWASAHRIPILKRHLEESRGDQEARKELDLIQRRTDFVVRSVADCHAAGVRLIAGTDAGWREVGFGDLVEELLLLTECGLSITETLASATRKAAEALRLHTRAGRVAPGWSADIAAVPADPNLDPAVLRRIRTITLRGTLQEQPRTNRKEKSWMQTS